MKHNQLGRFRIDSLFMVQQLDLVADIMAGLVVIDVTIDPVMDARRYLAVGPDFEATNDMQNIPEYVAEITENGDGTRSHRWVKLA